MKKPKYTDTHRYPNGYKKSAETNVEETFRRVRNEKARNEAEQEDKVRAIKQVRVSGTLGRSHDRPEGTWTIRQPPPNAQTP